jgi:hypothetical protein
MPDLNSPADGKGGRKVEPQEGFTRIFINLGKMDNLLPQTLMKMISQATGISNIEIGKIDILKTFSFFEVDSTYSKQVMDSMEGMEVKGRVVNLELAESQGRDNTRDRKSGRGGRSERSGGFRSREDRPSRDRGSRDRSPRRESSGERRSSERKSYGSRGSFGDSDRAPRGERSSREGRSSSSSSRSESSGERGGYRSRDDRAPREGRSSERKPYGSRSSFGESSSRSRSGDGDSSSRSRSGGDRDKKFGRSSDRKSRDRKSDGDSYGAKKSEKKVWINEEYSDKSKRGFGQVKKRKSKD